jgi:hypothetical protein
MSTNESLNKIAQTIRSQASDLLSIKKIEMILKEMGELFYTGSYALDLMTWNDIDMQLVLKEELDPICELGKFFTHMSRDSDFVEAQMIHFKGDFKPKMPRGIYLGIKLNSLAHGGMWKLDLWVLSKADFEKNRLLINTLKGKLNENNRLLILGLKHKMMRRHGRVPQMSSHLLYQAILLEGIEDRDLLDSYFKNQESF